MPASASDVLTLLRLQSALGMNAVSNAARALETRILELVRPPTAAAWNAAATYRDRTELGVPNPPQPIVPVPGDKSPLIYIVENDAEQAERLNRALSARGYRVRVFAGAETYRDGYADGEQPAALVAGIDASESESDAVAAIFNAGRNAAAPLIVISQRDALEARLAAHRAGASRYLVKPVDVEQLARMLDELTARIVPSPYRALLVDGDPAALETQATVLRRAGIEVRTVAVPLQILPALQAFEPDVLLLDVRLPGLCGTELAAVLRDQEPYAHLPIVFLSAENDMHKKLPALNLGGDDFLLKPVEPAYLLATVTARARRSRQNSATTERLKHTLYEWEREHLTLDQHAIVSIADASGRITYVNNKFCEISGYTREELLGQNHRIVKSDRHSAEFFRKMWRTIAAGRLWQGEVCNRRKDGGLYWVESTITPFLDADGRPYQYVSIRTDVTALKLSQQALKASDERLRRGQIYANIGTWDWNILSGELYWSERIAPLFGYAQGALSTSYENFLNAVHPDDRQAVNDAVNASVESDAPYEIEHRVVWPDGSVRWLLERGAVGRDDSGKPLRMLGVVQDIHERKMAEEALRESEERWSFAVEGAGDGVWDWNMLSGEMLFSKHYKTMLGYAENELAGHVDEWMSSIHPGDWPRVQENLNDYLQGRKSACGVELRLRCKDGSYKWILCRATVVARDGTGKPLRMTGIHSDINERKTTEERLALFARIFGASEQSIGVTDGEGRIVYFNAAHEQLLGYSLDEMAGRPFTAFLPEEEAVRIAQSIFAAAAKGETWSGLIPMRRKNDDRFISTNHVGFIADEDGRLQYLFNIFSDYTEEIVRQTELANAKESAERANQAKSNFLSSMSHELRTPMNAILGFAQLLEYDAGLDAEQRDSVHEIIKAGRHLLQLINEVLDLAKIESGHIDLSLEPVGLDELIEDCRHLIQPLAAARRISVWSEGADGAVVRADRVRLRQVLLNLLSNAVKYNCEEGSVRLSVHASPQGKLRLVVSDTGPGISAERLQELFQPFNRLDAGNSDIEGTGIGLTITRRLVEMMGGDIGVESTVGVGSAFWIELAEEITAAATDCALERHADVSATLRQAHRVLYIEDNPANLKLVVQILGRRPHIHLLTAHTPELGIELALAHKPELILLDINMPGRDGYRLLEIFKTDARLKVVPVVAVTANAMPRDIERGMQAGFAAYLTKPLDVEQFLNVVDARLPEPPDNALQEK
jgi:PAS domain S-box-containing protein